LQTNRTLFEKHAIKIEKHEERFGTKRGKRKEREGTKRGTIKGKERTVTIPTSNKDLKGKRKSKG